MLNRFVIACLCVLFVSVASAPAKADSLPAPTPPEITIHIGEAQNGAQIDVPVNERFAVELVGVPTAGYLWTIASMPEFITRAGDAGGPTMTEQTEPGFTGGRHWEVLLFAALEAGEGELVLVQKRPWEGGDIAEVFRITIAAADQ